jgi:hypothetical protein
VELLFRVSIILSNRAATAGDYAAGLKFLTKARALATPNWNAAWPKSRAWTPNNSLLQHG